jgi:hypothetical protein
MIAEALEGYEAIRWPDGKIRAAKADAKRSTEKLRMRARWQEGYSARAIFTCL